jgi:UPF0755 protein
VTLKSVVGATLLVGILASAAAASIMWRRLHEPYKAYAADQLIEIPTGAGSGAIGRRLIGAGIIRDDFTFRSALWWTGQSRSLQAGEYLFDRPLTPIDVVNRLARGDVLTRPLTFPEGLTAMEMAGIFESRGFGAASSFVEAAADGTIVHDLDPHAADLEGYLFPETYALARTTTARRLVTMMVDRFRDTVTEDLHRSAERQGLTLREVVTLASLVEKETGKPEERPLVAAVYRNRLKIGMPLQADPTVVYALQRAGKYTGNIRREDLRLDDRYNTYRYPGLPPGPIASPGQASLEAAVRPAAVDYLYFVSRNDGSHAFARTLVEHNRNVREFQVLYFRRKT